MNSCTRADSPRGEWPPSRRDRSGCRRAAAGRRAPSTRADLSPRACRHCQSRAAGTLLPHQRSIASGCMPVQALMLDKDSARTSELGVRRALIAKDVREPRELLLHVKDNSHKPSQQHASAPGIERAAVTHVERDGRVRRQVQTLEKAVAQRTERDAYRFSASQHKDVSVLAEGERRLRPAPHQGSRRTRPWTCCRPPRARGTCGAGGRSPWAGLRSTVVSQRSNDNACTTAAKKTDTHAP